MNAKLEKLREAYKAEKEDTRFIKRASVVLQVLDFDLSVVDVAKSVGCSRRVIYDWLDRFEQDGVQGLKDLPKSDRPTKVPEKVIIEIFENTSQRQ